MDHHEFRFKDKTYRCYFELTLDLIGGKWKPVIIYHLGQQDNMRYSDIRRKIPKITERMLTKQLRELESDGIVNRKIYPVIPPKVEYSLTKEGRGLMPVLKELRNWGHMYYSEKDGHKAPPK
tara:strand:+ start:729 stop:1094 length:366 start_codon:yes stop_codon:yes gene_type:complete